MKKQTNPKALERAKQRVKEWVNKFRPKKPISTLGSKKKR